MMRYVVVDPQLGPKEYRCHGLQAMRARIWEIAASGVQVIILEERSYEEASQATHPRVA